MTDAVTTAPRTLTRGQARLLAFTAGATCANLYYAQPLLPTIAASLHVSQTSASLLVTITQLSYGVGLLLLVPAADITRRRTLFTWLLGIDTAAVAASAAAPDLRALGAFAFVIGLTSVVIQMLIPFAATLAAGGERTWAIGTVLSGLLTGILLSRTFAGAVAQVAGWRGVYAVAAVLMAATTVTLYRRLPDLPPEIETGYAAQLREALSLVRTQPVLRWRALIGACSFGSFSAFWTTVSFLLARPPYDFNQLEIGLFALAGAAGALLSAFGGRHIDRRPQAPLARHRHRAGHAARLLRADRGRRRAPGLARPGAAGGRDAVHGCRRAVVEPARAERDLRAAAAGAVPHHGRLHDHHVHRRRARLLGRRARLRAVGLGGRLRGRRRVSRPRVAVLASRGSP